MQVRKLAVLLAASALAVSATAGTQVLSGSSSSAAASGTFVTGSGSVTITLENLWSSSFSAMQSLSGVDFSIAGQSSINAGTPSFVSGNLVSYMNGTFTNLTDPAPGAAGFSWYSSAVGGTLRLTALSGSVGETGPDLTINPNPQLYAGNASTRNDSHNPFFIGPVTFSLTGLQGVTEDSVVENVVFRFNTDGANTVTPPIPEPETYALMLAGLAVVGFVARRRKAAVTAA